MAFLESENKYFYLPNVSKKLFLTVQAETRLSNASKNASYEQDKILGISSFKTQFPFQSECVKIGIYDAWY